MKDFISDLPFVGDFVEHRPKVAVVRLSGVIADATMRKGGISYARHAQLIEKAFKLPHVREIALIINSPGGAPAQCALLGAVIRDCAKDIKVPVTAFVEDVAASGGYWLACAADKIYVQGSSIVGSIGVIAAGFGFEELIREYGIKRRVHTSGKDKSMLDPFLPEKPKDVERLKELQADIHAQFIDWVKTRRGARLKGRDADLFEGQIWTGAAAVPLGIADAIGDLRGVMNDKYGPKVRLIEFAPQQPFLKSMLGMGGAGTALADDLIGNVESRLYWQKYGL